MKRHAFSVLILFFWTISAVAQYFMPKSALVFKVNEISPEKISAKIRQTRAFFSGLDIDELRLKIRRNNNEVDNQISILKNKMSNAFIDKQELLKLKDISKIKERITEMEKNREKIKQEIQSDLANISYQGLFVVVLRNIDILDSKEKLAKKAEHLLAPQAVESLNPAINKI